MKHLEAGLMVGFIIVGASIVLSVAWGLVSIVWGGTNATIIVGLAVAATMLATFIDYITEKKP